MGDNNMAASGAANDEVTPKTVSALFDETLKKYFELMRGEENTASKDFQKSVTEMIGTLEDLTRQVSVLGILSDNENYQEMNPAELKFILLPFMMGCLWQLSGAESRERICHLCKVYFSDYLRRCVNYEVISKLIPEAKPDSEDEEESKKAKQPPKRSMNPEEMREAKIKRFREAKMLDEKITVYLDRVSKGQDFDEEDLQQFVVALLRRSAIEAEDQLRSISQEMELIKYAEKMKIGSRQPSSSSSSSSGSSSNAESHHHNHHHSHPHSHEKKDSKSKPPQIFILTKTQLEKQVFGAGYPAIPVMTVEELYEQRRKTGQWSPHVPSSSNNLPDPTETEDDRDAQREALVERDDEEALASQRQMDDYKDDHRRGWGNRYNRS